MRAPDRPDRPVGHVRWRRPRTSRRPCISTAKPVRWRRRTSTGALSRSARRPLPAPSAALRSTPGSPFRPSSSAARMRLPTRRRVRSQKPNPAPARFNPLYIHAAVGPARPISSRRSPGPARPSGGGCRLSHRRALHVSASSPRSHPVRDPLQGSAPRHRPPAHRRHAVPAGQVGAAGVLPHAQRADRRGRQVVVAADRPPAELETLDERVRSRLEGGVAFEIGAPDVELRRRNPETRRRAARRPRIPASMCPTRSSNTWPSRWTPNGRDLEGALNRLVAQWHSPASR